MSRGLKEHIFFVQKWGTFKSFIRTRDDQYPINKKPLFIESPCNTRQKLIKREKSDLRHTFPYFFRDANPLGKNTRRFDEVLC